MTPPREEAPRRLVDSPPDGSEASRLLRALPPAAAPEGARARVWRKVSAAPERRRRRWVMVPALAALAAVAVFAVSALRPGAVVEPPVLALSSGTVEQPAPSRVRTGAGSRALVRVGAAAVLLAEETEVEIDGAEVAVFRGRVAVATAIGSPLVLRAADRSVTGDGVFAAARVDSERFERAEVTEEERALLDRFGRGAGPESRLRVEAPEGYAVGIDGAQVGRSPLRALVPLGARALVGRREDGAQLSGEAVVVGGHETVVVLREREEGARSPGEAATGGLGPSAASGPGPARGPEAAKPPRHRGLKGSSRASEPAPPAADPKLSGSLASSGLAASSPGPTAPPESPLAPGTPEPGGALVPPGAPTPHPSDVATAADPDVEAYAKAKDLLARGEPAKAAAIFSDVARGRSSRAELSLYELGRTELRYLHDPAAARSAFSSYVERYPSGLLLQEVELSLIESELAGSDFAAARASMDRFLARHPRSERRHEVMLLRANLDRDHGDCAQAMERYRALSKGSGTIADDATYFAAVCAQKLGRPEEARTLLQDSLQRFPSGRHADEARRALAGP